MTGRRLRLRMQHALRRHSPIIQGLMQASAFLMLKERWAQKGCVRRSMEKLVQALRSFRDTTFPNGFGAKHERRDQAAAIGAGSSVAFFAAVILSVLSRRDEQSTVLRPSAISHPTPRPSGQCRGSSNRDSIHDVILTQRTQVVARVIVPLACERVG